MFKWPKKKIHSSIGNQYITAFLLCLVLPLVLLAVFFTVHLRQLLSNKEYQNMYEKVRIGGRSFDVVVQEMKDVVSSIIVNEDVMSILKSANDMPTYEWFQEFKTLENLLLSLGTRTQYPF